MKALMIATKPNWVKKIIDGEKDLEFRPYAIPKGTRVLVYESLGKKVGSHNLVYDKHYKYSGNFHEGRGKIVLEFTVGECYRIYRGSNIYKSEIENASEYILTKGDSYKVDKKLGTIDFFEHNGYTNQKYAHTITDLIVYDEEWIDEQLNHFDNVSSWDGTGIVIDWNYYDRLKNAPTEPQPITNYVGWKKLTKYKNDINRLERNTGDVGYLIEDEKQSYLIGKSWESVEENKYQNLKWDMYLTSPPQGRVWIYMEDE